MEQAVKRGSLESDSWYISSVNLSRFIDWVLGLDCVNQMNEITFERRRSCSNLLIFALTVSALGSWSDPSFLKEFKRDEKRNFLLEFLTEEFELLDKLLDEESLCFSSELSFDLFENGFFDFGDLCHFLFLFFRWGKFFRQLKSNSLGIENSSIGTTKSTGLLLQSNVFSLKHT